MKNNLKKKKGVDIEDCKSVSKLIGTKIFGIVATDVYFVDHLFFASDINFGNLF